MTCPDADHLARLVEDKLGAEARLAIEDHLDTCDDCRATVAMLVRTAAADRRSGDLGRFAAGDGESLGAQPENAALAPTLLVRELESTVEGDRADRSQRAPLSAGTTIGRYVIGSTLGMGGMGIVYSAHDPDLNRDIAIKILRPEFARAHPDSARRIVREAQAMARVAHPNVVAVFDVGTIEDRVFIAMERISGTSLRHWLAAKARTAAEIIEAFTAAGRGLIAAHDAGIVHRDFKPDNVLVGTDGRVRVTDFGLAYDGDDHEAVEDSRGDSMTRPIVGTPAYMAPEQHAGAHVDARTDQFSFTVALYEALYRERPFVAVTRAEIVSAVTHGRVSPPPPGSRIPASLRAILARGLAVTPGARFPTLAELLKALGRDRGRGPRAIGRVALVVLLAVVVAFGADAIMRERTRAITRTDFAAARRHLDQLVALRTETFVSQSDALYRLPAVLEVASLHDLADFGLADPAKDRVRLAHIHDNLRSADWVALTGTRRSDVLAIADHKGRLLFNSADPAVWNTDVGRVGVIAAAYDARADTTIGLIRGADPAVVASGLLGGQDHGGMYVLFARVKRIGDQPRAMFVQLIEAARLLRDVGVGEGTDLSVVTSDGVGEGSVPATLIAHATDGIAEVTDDGEAWLVQHVPLEAAGQSAAIAELVLARRTDVGLAGLFPDARGLLGIAACLLALLVGGGFAVARQRDLARH